MLAKPYHYQKIDDLIRGYGELFRIEHFKMLSYFCLREIECKS